MRIHRTRPARPCMESLEARTAPAVYTVTTTDDVIDPNDGALSLREAVIASNSTPGATDTVTFDPAYFAVPRAIVLTGGELPIADAVTVQGPGAGLLTIDGNHAGRIFSVDHA